MFTNLVSMERSHPAAKVLVVTNGWPHKGDKTYCVFIKRQVESIEKLGLGCDVLFIRGFVSPFAYIVTALLLFWWATTNRKKYMVVHSHGGETSLAARFYWRAPVLASYLGDDLLGTRQADGSVSLPGRLKRTLIGQYSRLMTATITKSKEMESVLPHWTQRRNWVVPNGVDRDAFRPMDKRSARAALNWDANAPIAVFVANPSNPRKRFRLAAGAMSSVKKQFPAAMLQVASGLDHKLIPLVMNAADCLVFPSSQEGSPNAVKEALMCDLPVIATEVGDIRELLQGVEPSYLVEPSERAVAEAMIDCFARGVRCNGRARHAALAADAVARRIVDMYATLTGEHRSCFVRTELSDVAGQRSAQ